MTTATPDTMTEIPDMMIEKTPISFRHEMKHQITLHEDRILSGRLDRLFSHDSHAGTGGCYQVTSLYFDTPDDKALRQKVSGVSRREKFRIRYYGEDLSFIRLEKKIKEGGLCAKRSTRLTAEQVELLLGGRIRFLTDSGDPLMIELYSKMKGELLRPVTVVNYEREAFVYSPGNVRVTLDRKLRTGMSPNVFFSPRTTLIPVGGDHILEVKYDAFLPELVRLAVHMPDRKTGTYSKYAVCRKYD